MRRIVDASAFVDAVLPTTRQDAALAAFDGADLAAPGILDLEVLSAVGRLLRAGEITGAEAEVAVRALHSAPILRLDDRAIAMEAWALRDALRVSDAFYVAAARAFDADLVTSDARLSRAPTHGVTVILLR